jgi:hypothetical protein
MNLKQYMMLKRSGMPNDEMMEIPQHERMRRMSESRQHSNGFHEVMNVRMSESRQHSKGAHEMMNVRMSGIPGIEQNQ